MPSLYFTRDNVFAVFESESDANVFYNYLNARHENIKFIFEKRKITNSLF